MSVLFAPSSDLSDLVTSLYGRRANDLYLGEPVTVYDHALQSATIAELDGAPSSLITAALLHDVGQLIRGAAEDAVRFADDEDHARVGGDFLASYFLPEVAGAVRLHVQAKRFLSTTEAGYPATLTPAARMALVLCGGAMTIDEAARFRARPHADAAIRLRRYCDRAKQRNLTVPGFRHFARHVDASARRD
ncbi:HD domain-containing protein [Tistrella bauzanensis]|jgi:predicted HD phosphohydrolase|uniref:HD domain-containing protein n=1 Tax=Tistrella arctica TaxID=3133430 RepID=A0ABU9YHW5_9PROT